MNYKLLASDLDGTLIPAKDENIQKANLTEFSELANKFFYITYVTGRHFDYAKRGIINSQLPEPNYLICDVGTSIYVKNIQNWTLDDSYLEYLSKKWGKGTDLKVINLLNEISNLRLQELEKQGNFKCSFYVNFDINIENLVKQIEEILIKEKIIASIITSKDIATDQFLIDILPKDVSKFSALSFLTKKLDLKTDQIIYAGDSGNDLKVFTSDIPSILVANTPSEVVMKVKENKVNQKFYVAKNECMCGVIEGMQYFFDKNNK